MAYLSDQEQKDIVKNFWKEYGIYIVVFVVAFLGGHFFWRYYNAHKARSAEVASVVYTQMLNARQTKQTEQFNDFATKLKSDYKSSPYASLAALFLADSAVDNNKLDVAKEQLNWVIDHGSQKVFAEMARIRLARLLLSEKKNQEALDILHKINAKELLAIVYEVRGDIYLAMDKKDQAKKEYQKALDAATKLDVKAPLVEMKLRGEAGRL